MDKLQELYGVGDVTAEKLHKSGYNTYEQIASATVDELVEKVGIPARSAGRIIQSAQEMLQEVQTRESEIETARKALQELQSAEFLETEQPEIEVSVEPEAEEPAEEIPEEPTEEVPEEPTEEILEELEEAPPEVPEEEIPTEPEAAEQPEQEIPAEEAPEVSEEPPRPTAIDLYGIADELVEAIVQNPEVMNQLAEDIGSELADIITKSKEIRGKIIQKALSQQNFRKTVISRIVEKLS